MKRHLSLFIGAFLLLRAPRILAEASPTALAAFNTYAGHVESGLAQRHHTPETFLELNPTQRARLRSGELLIENLTPASQPSDALIHHWRATAFVPNATPADFERLLRDFSAYPHNFAPEILSSTVLTSTPTHTLLRLRTRQHHVITVVLDTTCDVAFAALDPAHGYSISRSTRIDEITPSGDQGFLYRLNTYWSYEQRAGGLYLQLESLSLTRAIPRGLAWAVRPYLESIPRESLLFTLNSARNALRKPPQLKTAN
ncbi:MAG TPA: hypothetical protein VGU25_08665 [Acidobacteriaceae bacterium]|nr:hypothetical protein [Acidobacteriaceae bacterium]